MINLIDKLDTIELIVENSIKEQYRLINFKVSYIGVEDFIKEYLIKRKVDIDRVKIVDFDKVDY